MRTAQVIRVRGQVQGVGFRPFVWWLAREAGLDGFVLNDAEGVLIRVAGPANVLDTFRNNLSAKAPPLARVDSVEVSPWEGAVPPGFEIASSGEAGAETRVTPDAATCPACLEEIRGDGRRAGYAFTNCTHCGPRFTIIQGLPYDRAQTTMSAFDMCADCAREYADPSDRRFHAQPIACPNCGPRLWLEVDGIERGAIDEAADELRQGGILAVKGLGGFHLACDATNAGSVALLRTRKRRPSKPFALMGTPDMIQRYALVTDAEWGLLGDPAAPIVLLARSENALPEPVAPGQSTLGWMLPYTPLHHLLIEAVGSPLIMTSGNLSGEPQVIGNAEAREKLAPFVDGFLMHDRDIARRLDDSVERITRAGPMVLRRARGRVPGTLPLPDGFDTAPQVLAMGGQMKAALCLLKNGQALLGHHMGELDEALTWDAYEAALADYTDLFDHAPAIVAVDSHEGYRATQAGMSLGLPITQVQHHHAHLAAVMGEHALPLETKPFVGIVLDGLGLGDDGTIWGGEVLLGDYRAARRIGHLQPAPLPGGDGANRDPWRNALARLDMAGLSDWADQLFPDAPRQTLRMAVAKGVNAPLSSSMGRLFDAVAAILGICPDHQSFEGEAAMRLEAFAQAGAHQGSSALQRPEPSGDTGIVTTTHLFGDLRAAANAGVSLEQLAYDVHRWIVQAFAPLAKQAVDGGNAAGIALSGGVFQNALLLDLFLDDLQDYRVIHHQSLPANDGSLAYGQALVAAARTIG